MAGARLVVTPPPAAAPRVGLLVSALQPEGEGERWGNGITYDPETGQVGYRVDECDPGASDRDLEARRDDVEWEPYIIGDGIVCTAMAARGRDWNAQARRQLDAVAEFQISSELWSGTLATAHTYPNRYLTAGGDAIAGSPFADTITLLAALEQYLADCAGGQRGMIHAPRDIVTQWVADGMITRQGALLLTVHDTIVVPGAGYTGSTAVATSMVEVRRGPITITGDPIATPEQVDRSLNTVEVRAEQQALASWDLSCHGIATLS